MKFEYFGDQWLGFDDIYESMSYYERLGFIMNGGSENINHKFLAHATGQKDELKKHMAFTIGINKVFRKDPEKYKKIWDNPKRRGIRITTMSNNHVEPLDNTNYIG